MSQAKLAELLSVILGPQLWCPVLLFVLMYASGLSSNQILYLLPYLTLLLIGIPFLTVYIATKRGIISAWDMPKRQERYGFFIFFACLYGIAMLTTPIRTTPVLWEMSLLILAFIVLNTAITFFWKISLHMGVATLTLLIVNYLYDWRFFFLFLLIPVVAWSRVSINRHTLAQVTAGTVLPVLLFLLFKF